MGTNLEIENKYLVKPPTSWSALAEMFDQLVDIKRISQMYLVPPKGQQSPRVRKTLEGLTGETSVVYHYNQKTPVEAGVHKEKEREITKSQYEKYLKDGDPNKRMVEKTRFVFKYRNQTFELDVFKGYLKGLAILEIELENTDDKVELPPYLEVIKEITNDKRYNNFNLANRKSQNS